MAKEQIRIEQIGTKDLYKFALRVGEATEENGMLPIGKPRALAYSTNPCADENDIGLLVAYLGGKCIGYLGIMPGLLRRGDQFSKIYWLSTWFVPPEFRKTSVGLHLLLNALSLKYDLVVCGMSDEAEGVYRGLRFRELGQLKYCIINFEILNLLGLGLRVLRKILRRLGVQFEIPGWIVRLSAYMYTPIRNVLYSIVSNDPESRMNRIRCEEVSEIDAVTKKAHYDAASVEFHRGTEILNWMLNYRWTKERDKSEKADQNYYFSEVRDIFKYIAVKVYSTERMDYRGYLVFSFSAKDFYSVLKVLDFHFSNYDDQKYVALLALKYARIHQAGHVELPESVVTYLEDSPILKLLAEGKKRIYFFHPKDSNSPLATFSADVELNYCDGDTPFT